MAWSSIQKKLLHREGFEMNHKQVMQNLELAIEALTQRRRLRMKKDRARQRRNEMNRTEVKA